MFCIAAFIILGILAIFSASYRPLAKKAWHCVGRKIRFKPCDISFAEEMKGRLLGKLIIRRPKLAKFLDRWIDVLSFIFVILTIWSLATAFLAGLNLWVYDTCNPTNGESCSLGGEACGLERPRMSLWEAVSTGELNVFFSASFKDFAETISRIPDRLKNWQGQDYVALTGVYYYPFDASKVTAVEAIDPSCKFCRQLFANIKQAGFEKTHNLSFILFPIPSKENANGYKFPHSYLMASYIEAVKKVPLKSASNVDPAWQLLEKLFGEMPNGNTSVFVQDQFNTVYTQQQAESKLQELLHEIGYSDEQVSQIATLATSTEVHKALRQQADIVENKLRTVKIPTIVFGGRRYDRLVDVNTLR